jgi:CHAT domain-containing protein/predicted negative regulator of RcsB-dependent stress response
MQGLTRFLWAFFLRAGVPAGMLSVLLLAPFGTWAQSLPDAEMLAGRQARAQLDDTDTIFALTAEGAALYDRDAVKLTGYQYCSQAVALADAGDFRQSVRAASKALYLAERTNDPNLRALANRDLAIAFSYAGQFDKAVEFAREALRSPALDSTLVVGPANKVIGDVQARRGDYSGAIATYETALDSSSTRYAPLVRVSLANALIESGGTAEIERAARILGELKPPADPALDLQLERTRGRLLLAQNKPREARAVYQRLGARSGGSDGGYARLWGWDGVARADLALGDKPGAVEAVTRALGEVDAVRARFRSEEFKMGLFFDLQDVFDRGVGLYSELGDASRAYELSERSRSRALLDSVRERARVDPDLTADTIDLPTLQRALANDERVVQFHALPDRLIVWLVSPTGIESKTIAVKRDELDELVETFRNSVVRGRRTAIANADRLGTALIAPLGLAEGLRLIVVPHGPLHYLPFQALRVNGRYLIEMHPIAISPSMSIAAQLAQRPPRVAAALTAFGNPQIAEKYDLPGAEAEVRQIIRFFPRNRIYLGAQATKTQFNEAVGSAPIVHIAAHAQADELDPLYSRILLANENGQQNFLEAHEILDLPMRGTALVTLSACESGLGRVAGGDEVLGFPRAFLSAGASALIASLWPVSDDATEVLMSALYRELAAGRDLQRAMQAGQLAVLRQPQTAHPFFWAPFNLIGDWRLTVSQGQ